MWTLVLSTLVCDAFCCPRVVCDRKKIQFAALTKGIGYIIYAWGIQLQLFFCPSIYLACTPYSMVSHIIRADILLVAWYFSEACRGEEKYEQWAKSSNRRLLFHYKKIVILQLASIFLVRVFRNILIPSVRMTLTMGKMFALNNICQTIEWEVNYSTAKKMLFWLLFSILFLSAGSSSSAIVAPFASALIRPVVNRLIQDTTVYYGLVFCAFCWRYMVKRRYSGIINTLYMRTSLTIPCFQTWYLPAKVPQ